ncbi:MAG: hypothetical protein M0Z39_08760 [Actinomycetota bacterium]|nr:hypothetical protein [Actinomycetota bacterium]
MSDSVQIVIGMAVLAMSALVLGNAAISWLMPSDTKKMGLLDLVKRFGGYKSALEGEDLRQALAILDRDATWFDSKVSSSMLVTALCGVVGVLLTFFTVGSLPAALAVLSVAAVLTIPLGIMLAKASVIGTADSERRAFRSILAMYLTVLGVELRSHPIEISLRDIAEITYSPIALRITGEIQKKIDSVAQAPTPDGSSNDMSLGRAMVDLGRDWAIPELELIGEIMHGSVFSPEALSEMILQQAETMKKTMMREYAKKVEAQRPKLSMFALLQIMPLVIFLVVPIMATLGKVGGI